MPPPPLWLSGATGSGKPSRTAEGAKGVAAPASFVGASSHVALLFNVLLITEPIIMEGSSEFKILRDKWTAVSVDNKRCPLGRGREGGGVSVCSVLL